VSEFEFLLSLYGLVLGLAFANVATGWRSRREMTLGWCTPLLALFLTLATTGTWLTMWEGREELTLAPVPVLVSLASFFPLVFLSRAIFPQPNEGWSSLEDYYMAHRRVIVGAVILTRLIGVVQFMLGDWPGMLAIAYLAARIALLTVMFFVGSVWLHRAGWAVLSLGVLWWLLT